ncbi:transglutaminase-like cysteine peptidase [Candidatus Kaiserbacteria bacterium]|nr:transglutaminase-like cysteine peptidase [Candidatus Kaiserbacteria bacterium]
MRVRIIVALVIALCALAGEVSADAPRMTIGATASAPAGWVQFCKSFEHEWDCDVRSKVPHVVTLTQNKWDSLVLVNSSVNGSIKPKTDEEHWGFDDPTYVFRDRETGIKSVDRWSYPDDGYGDCEDYVLLKRWKLAQAGWPLDALLITVVLDKENTGHAVLTVVTDMGEFILDIKEPDIRLWSETGYRFKKRQSQTDPNVWVAISDPSNVGSVLP